MKKVLILGFIVLISLLPGLMIKASEREQIEWEEYQKNYYLNTMLKSELLNSLTSDEIERIVNENYDQIDEDTLYYVIDNLKQRDEDHHEVQENQSSLRKKDNGNYIGKDGKVTEKFKEKFNTFNGEAAKDYLIPGSDFIVENLNLYTTYNIDSTCGYVAATLMLSYHNHMLVDAQKPALVKDKYEFTLKNDSPIEGFNKGSNTIDSFYVKNKLLSKEFHDFLYVKVGKEEKGYKNWLRPKDMRAVMNWIIKDSPNYDWDEIVAKSERHDNIPWHLKNRKTPVVVTFFNTNIIILIMNN